MERFKILLVVPRHRLRFLSVEVPLGPLYLSSFLKKELGGSVDVRLLDLRLHRRPESRLARELEDFSPDIVGFTLFTQDAAYFDKTYLPVVRRHVPRARVVIGGPYPSSCPEEAVSTCRGVDCAVVGEGEVVFKNIVQAAMEGNDFHALDGIAYLDGDKPVCNPRAPFIEDLDLLPFPDYDLVKLSRYQSLFAPTMNGIVADRRWIQVMSSRGCPFRCAYCHNIFGKSTRKRSVDNFLAEIRMLYEDHGIREFQIVDDIFNLDRERMHAILEAIIASGMRIRLSFPNGLRGDMLTFEDIMLLKRAGAYMLTFAIETASPRVQRLIGKNLDIDKVASNIRFAHKEGFITRGFFMLGFPTETVEEIRQTVSLATSLPLDFTNFFSVVPFPGTRLYELYAETYPDIFYRYDCSHFWTNMPAYKVVTGVDIVYIIRLAFLRFYLPFRWARSLAKAPMKIQGFYQAARLVSGIFRI